MKKNGLISEWLTESLSKISKRKKRYTKLISMIERMFAFIVE